MKKFLFLIVCALAFAIMTYNIVKYNANPQIFAKNGEAYRECFNNETNMALARNIAAMTTAKEVAVIGNDDGVLVGVLLKSGTGERSTLRNRAEELVQKSYPQAKISVEIETEKAEKIISLASQTEKGIPKKILSSRITYLLEN